MLEQCDGRSPCSQSTLCMQPRNPEIVRCKSGALRESVERSVKIVERLIKEAGPEPQLRIRVLLRASAHQKKGFLFAFELQSCTRKLHQLRRVPWFGCGDGFEAHAAFPAGAPSASIRWRTASHSISLRSGCQTSKMKTTRNSSDGFSASCSIVSSKTKASPGFHCRVSAPTLNQQPSGTISGKWHTSRELLTPTCAGMCAFGASNENIALGPAPAMTGCGTCARAARVFGQWRALASMRLPFWSR